MPKSLDDLIDAGYDISGPGGQDGWTATGHGRSFDIPATGADQIVEQAQNHATLYSKLTQAQQVFADNYTSWGTMTAGQKDTANRNAQRALGNLIRHVRNDLSSGGV